MGSPGKDIGESFGSGLVKFSDNIEDLSMEKFPKRVILTDITVFQKCFKFKTMFLNFSVCVYVCVCVCVCVRRREKPWKIYLKCKVSGPCLLGSGTAGVGWSQGTCIFFHAPPGDHDAGV